MLNHALKIALVCSTALNGLAYGVLPGATPAAADMNASGPAQQAGSTTSTPGNHLKPLRLNFNL